MNETPTSPEATRPIVGVEALRAALKHVPNAPGIYKMLDGKGTVLYVGKAKNLFNRVTSYTNLGNHNTRILTMVNKIHSVETVVVQNEAEALLAEAGAIRKFSPRYNVLLKDDKSFPYLRLDTSHGFPRIEKHRGAQNKPGEYFGPFANVGALNATMAVLQKIFLLRPCEDSIFKNRSRPCLQYQIKRCTAPCVGLVSEADYAEQVKRARDFLKGKGREVQEMLAVEMNAASDAMEYEKAAALRDRIKALTSVQQQQGLRVLGLEDADVIAMARKGDKSVVQVYFYRDGTHFGSQSYYPKHGVEESDAEVLEGFLGQFYQAHLPPSEILLSMAFEELPLLAEALTIRAEAKVAIWVPARGDKLQLVESAQKNAQAALEKHMMERANVTNHLMQVKELFALPAMPQRIEVYDNSHISGTNAIGAFIVATPDGFEKKSYRTFTIKDVATEPGDDFAMMREVFRRRFKGVVSEDDSHDSRLTTHDLPDLILIDGGQGQLSAVEQALAEIGVEGLKLVAVAKGKDRNAGREWFHQPGLQPFQLPPNDPTLHYIERLRDEAHRFAIGRHRNKRSKSFTASALDDIPSIGPSRKRELLQHFGSRKGVETATLAELYKVKGISKQTAQIIYDYFHG